jgi:hypothetical protein
MKVEIYARKCDHCGSVMNEGFVVGGGEAYFCEEECRNKGLDITDKEWEEEWYCDGNTENYYTDWDDPTEYSWISINGEIHEIEIL